MTPKEILVKNEVFEKPEISGFNLILFRDAHICTQEYIEKSMLEFGKQCFEAGREFNSKDGTVDINVVIFYKGADNSDLEPLYPLFEDYLKSLEKCQTL